MKKVLLIENHRADFYSYRFPFLLYLKNKGWDVHALVPSNRNSDITIKNGIKIIEYDFDRSNKGIVQLFKLFFLCDIIIVVF